jgi:hypothetical protein
MLVGPGCHFEIDVAGLNDVVNSGAWAGDPMR